MILGTICIRGGSKGVPRKNVRLLDGVPLMNYSIETAQNCRLLDDLIISTDDAEMAERAKKLGVKVPFMRPPELAGDKSSKWDVFIHAVETYEKLFGKQITYLVDMDVTVPLKTSGDIEGAINLALSDNSADVIITGYEPERNPYFNMMEVREDGFAEIVKKPVKPIVCRQDAPIVYSLTPAAYVIKRSALFGYSHWSQAKCKIHPIPRNRAIDIDTELDFNIVEYLIKTRNAK